MPVGPLVQGRWIPNLEKSGAIGRITSSDGCRNKSLRHVKLRLPQQQESNMARECTLMSSAVVYITVYCPY